MTNPVHGHLQVFSGWLSNFRFGGDPKVFRLNSVRIVFVTFSGGLKVRCQIHADDHELEVGHFWSELFELFEDTGKGVGRDGGVEEGGGLEVVRSEPVGAGGAQNHNLVFRESPPKGVIFVFPRVLVLACLNYPLGHFLPFIGGREEVIEGRRNKTVVEIPRDPKEETCGGEECY